MKRILLLTVTLIMAVGCARLPVIVPESSPVADPDRDIVSRIYPLGDWQFSHAIHATVPGGKTVEMMGISVISSADGSIRCVLMTLEGIVLFSGRFDGKLTVERAMSPFDRSGFAEGLMRDLKLLFFAPRARLERYGRLPDGERVVRFCSKEKVTTDLVLREDRTWAIYEYSPRSKLTRSVKARGISSIGGDGNSMAAQSIVLKRSGLLGYRLDMRLVEAIKLTPVLHKKDGSNLK